MASFLIAAGLEVGGYQNTYLSVFLLVVAAIFLCLAFLDYRGDNRKPKSLFKPSEKNKIHQSNLSLYYREDRHKIQAAHDVVYYCVGLKNTKREAMDQISIRLKHIEPLGDKERLGKLITRLQGVPLMLREDLEGQTELPKTDCFLYGGEETEVLILLETTAHGDTRVDIKHAVYEFGLGRTSTGDRARKPKFSEHVPHGRYLLTIEARGPDGSSDEKQFTFTVSPDTFSFQEVNS